MTSSVFRPLYVTDNNIECFLSETQQLIKLFFPSGKPYDGHLYPTITSADIEFVDFIKNINGNEINIEAWWIQKNPNHTVFLLNSEECINKGIFTIDKINSRFELVIFSDNNLVSYYKIGKLNLV